MAWSEREAVAGLALMAMYADDVIAAEEDDVLRGRLLSFPLFHDLDDDGLGRVLAGLERAIGERGTEAVLRECAAAVGPFLRPTAYLVAADVVAADGEVVPDEHEYLVRVRKALALPAEEVRAIHDVLAFRARR